MMAKDPENRYQTGGEILKDMLLLRDHLGDASGSMLMPAISLGDLPSPDESLAATTRLMQPQRHWLRWVVAASLAAALVIGAVLGFWKGPALVSWARAKETPAAAPSSAAGDSPLALHSREQALEEVVKQHLTATDKVQISTGLANSQELGLLYFEQDRLDEADNLFTRLEQTKPYHDFGQLGHAMVLAFRNDPSDSNKKFQEWLGDKQQKQQHLRFLRENPQIAQMFLKALHHNKENAADHRLPESLDSFRKSLLTTPRTPGSEKPSGKGP